VTRVIALAARELRSYFLSPVGYIIIALFALLMGLIFVFFTFEPGQPATIRAVFSWGTWVLLFVCPAISMRAISEERRQGTYETLITSPISESELIAAKFAAALLFLLLMFVPTGVIVVVLELYGAPDYGELACGYLGMTLAGSTYLASGILASALTTSQIVAFLVPLFFWMIVNLGCKLLPPYLNERWANLTSLCDADQRLREFTIGLLDTSNVVFFITLSVVFLITASRVLQARRWG
jgi:ABC-2 type transport system permease protein